MASKVIWTFEALKDLRNAANYIAQDSKYYAAEFAAEVRRASTSLTKFADRGRVVPEVNDLTVRELFVGHYRLIYRTRKELIEIIALIHGARDMKHSDITGTETAL